MKSFTADDHRDGFGRAEAEFDFAGSVHLEAELGYFGEPGVHLNFQEF